MEKTSIKRGKTVFRLPMADRQPEKGKRQAAVDGCGLPTL
jgi:hypothetical protein